jgi:predicted flap endonuclease-1-like 5' DNA nuclease
MATKLIEIEGIGPAMSGKLEEAGLKTVEELLASGGSAKGRKDLAEATGISASRILRWVNMADLFRLKGVGEQYADLLEASGVDTVKELARRNAANLHAKMEEVNAERNLVNRTPSLAAVTSWIEEAGTLEPMVSH